jgi:hypothetical protein
LTHSHNLGLLHANENGEEYEDKTGYMGSAPQILHYPEKCYNGQNHWHLGWYEDRALELDFGSSDLDSPVLLYIAAFVDYDKTDEGFYVVVKIGDYYLQYNRARSFNKQTSEKGDTLTVVKYVSSIGTDLVVGLNWALPYWEGSIEGEKLVVELCETERGDNISPDFMIVSVGRGESACSLASVPSSVIKVPEETPSLTPVPSRFSRTLSPVPSPVTQAPTSWPTEPERPVVNHPTNLRPDASRPERWPEAPKEQQGPTLQSPSLEAPKDEQGPTLQSPSLGSAPFVEVLESPTMIEAPTFTSPGFIPAATIGIQDGRNDSGISTVSLVMIALSTVVVALAICLCAWQSKKNALYWFADKGDHDELLRVGGQIVGISSFTSERDRGISNVGPIEASMLTRGKYEFCSSRSTVSTDSSPDRSRGSLEEEKDAVAEAWFQSSTKMQRQVPQKERATASITQWGTTLSSCLFDEASAVPCNASASARPWAPLAFSRRVDDDDDDDKDLEEDSNAATPRPSTTVSEEDSFQRAYLSEEGNARVSKYEPIPDLGDMVRICGRNSLPIYEAESLQLPVSKEPPKLPGGGMQIISLAPIPRRDRGKRAADPGILSSSSPSQDLPCPSDPSSLTVTHGLEEFRSQSFLSFLRPSTIHRPSHPNSTTYPARSPSPVDSNTMLMERTLAGTPLRRTCEDGPNVDFTTARPTRSLVDSTTMRMENTMQMENTMAGHRPNYDDGAPHYWDLDTDDMGESKRGFEKLSKSFNGMRFSQT